MEACYTDHDRYDPCPGPNTGIPSGNGAGRGRGHAEWQHLRPRRLLPQRQHLHGREDADGTTTRSCTDARHPERRLPRRLVVTEMGSRPDKAPAAAAVNTNVSRRRALADQSGFTLVEVMVAVIILLAGVLGDADAPRRRERRHEPDQDARGRHQPRSRAHRVRSRGAVYELEHAGDRLGDAAAAGPGRRQRGLRLAAPAPQRAVHDHADRVLRRRRGRPDSATTTAATSAATPAPRARPIQTPTTTDASPSTSPGRTVRRRARCARRPSSTTRVRRWHPASGRSRGPARPRTRSPPTSRP